MTGASGASASGPHRTPPRVVVVGGAGFFGRHVVADLLQHTEAQVVVADRHPRRAPRHPRVIAASCDANDVPALSRLAEGAQVVVHCAGPFHTLPLGPVKVAMAARAHYVDISEDRSFREEVAGFHDEARDAGVALLTGMSVVPAMEALAAEVLRPRFDDLVAVRTFVAPDTRRHRGMAMFHTMLRLAGRHSDILRDGRRVQVLGWSEPKWVQFPPPVGRRLTYLVPGLADQDVLPELLGVETVEFRAGSEQPWLNRLLGWASALRSRTGHPRLERYTQPVRALSWIAGRFGRDRGAAMFEVTGRLGSSVEIHRVAVVADKEGGRIPAVLAGMAVEPLLRSWVGSTGVVAANAWITPEAFVDSLIRRGLRIVQIFFSGPTS